MGGQARARRPKLRVERRPFLASKAVIFGVNFTGPYILDVKSIMFGFWVDINTGELIRIETIRANW